MIHFHGEAPELSSATPGMERFGRREKAFEQTLLCTTCRVRWGICGVVIGIVRRLGVGVRGWFAGSQDLGSVVWPPVRLHTLGGEPQVLRLRLAQRRARLRPG